MQRLDHGLLNIPLAKRGDIDAQIDRFKADQARQEKAERKARAAERRILLAEAKDLIDTLPVGFVERAAPKLGLTQKQYVARLRSMANTDPARFIPTLRKVHAEAAA